MPGFSNGKNWQYELKKHHIIDFLSAYDPVLVSTVCVNLDIDGSDLDIICQHKNLEEFKIVVKKKFGQFPDFKQWMRKSDFEKVVTAFKAGDFEIEIFSSIIPVKEQFAYRHLLMMDRTLQIGGEPLREKVKALKRDGLKTEPAFAKILGLSGDPFLAFLELEKFNDDQLNELIKKNS